MIKRINREKYTLNFKKYNANINKKSQGLQDINYVSQEVFSNSS